MLPYKTGLFSGEINMLPRRISIKFFTKPPIPLNLPALVPVFQRWIQEHAVEGLLIDVADYDHVPNGPGVLLIGHEGDYSYDLRGGRAGLLYTRKRDLPGDLPNTLTLITRLAVLATQKLAAEPTLNGLRFDLSQAEITFLDRLNFPNTPESFERVREVIGAFAGNLYGSAQVEAVVNDPRDCFAVRMTGEASLDGESLLSRLASGQTMAG
jgi:hypothetical protein